MPKLVHQEKPNSVQQEKYPEAVLEHLEIGASAVFRYSFEQWYLPSKPQLELLVVALADNEDGGALKLVLCPASRDAERALSDANDLTDMFCLEQLSELAAVWKVPVINLANAIKLQPVLIPKPWGQEIWYTGMEERGLSSVSDGRYTLPLAWLIGLAPSYLLGRVFESGQNEKNLSPNLLKILDPLPEPVYGDLYFELHEEKREVYVVTEVDEQAWPKGVGGIRYGIDPQARQRYSSEAALRAAFLAAVEAYRKIRKRVDDLIDLKRLRDGVQLNKPVSAQQIKQWQQELPPELREEEVSLRKVMDDFTGIKPLRRGDVVKVPLLTPHALQHGVRTAEFQTPVYERKILSFAQKVLTQDVWDSAEAIALMSVKPEVDDDLKLLEDGLVKREQIVSFEDFEVQRISLNSHESWTLTLPGSYSLVMAIQGVVSVNGQELGQEEAAFVPACCGQVNLQRLSTEPCIVLISLPRV